ncbi:hypothetical protein HanXRQr2_Chr15g0677731 [Helianthus annuus]|uniref:Uncharacterized protein n=1 Tax=Helianthus annuus TaxID=4232 RepID=A0A9K3DYY0_HELAN|nr:hypothetical protein HanXRQr2_Chr15g0677731 [Helianthus annuus]KAJ0829960.1 hypothetical protein HanPSC8_Chr15g0649761 [Helianthus annuus]
MVCKIREARVFFFVDDVSMKRAEFLPVDFRDCAIAASRRHEWQIKAHGLDILLFRLFVSPVCEGMSIEAQSDSIENISEMIVLSPLPLTTVETGKV